MHFQKANTYVTYRFAPAGSRTLRCPTLITMAPVPSLRAYISNFGTGTNYIAIRWPTQPAMFVLQQSYSLGSNALWQTLPNVGGSNLVFREYRIPVSSAGPAAFYRLVLESSQPRSALGFQPTESTRAAGGLSR